MFSRSGKTFSVETVCSCPGECINSGYGKPKLMCRELSYLISSAETNTKKLAAHFSE